MTLLRQNSRETHEKFYKLSFFIPKEDMADFGEIEVIEKPYMILIKPKSLTDKTKGIVNPLPSNFSEIIKEELSLWR